MGQNVSVLVGKASGSNISRQTHTVAVVRGNTTFDFFTLLRSSDSLMVNVIIPANNRMMVGTVHKEPWHSLPREVTNVGLSSLRMRRIFDDHFTALSVNSASLR